MKMGLILAGAILLASCSESDTSEGPKPEKEIEETIENEERAFMEKYGFATPNSSNSFLLYAIRRAQNERIIYRLRCTTPGSKCFQNIQGKFRVVYHIPESINLASYPGLTTRTLVFEEIGLAASQTSDDAISLYSTVFNPIKPQICPRFRIENGTCTPASQSEYFKYYVNEMLNASLPERKLIRSIFHVTSTPGQADTLTSLNTVNSIFPRYLVSDLLVRSNPLGADPNLIYDFAFRPEHLSQIQGTGHRDLQGNKKSAKLFNVENAFISHDGRISMKRGSILKVEDIFEGSMINKRLTFSANEAVSWVIGTPDNGFYAEPGWSEVSRTLTVGFNTQRKIIHWANHSQITIDLYRLKTDYELIVNDVPTGFMVPFSQISQLSRPVAITFQPKDTGPSGWQFQSITLHKSSGLDDFPFGHIPAEYWVGTEILGGSVSNSLPQIRWNNGTELLGSVYAIDSTGEKRWLVSQGTYNSQFKAKFNDAQTVAFLTPFGRQVMLPELQSRVARKRPEINLEQFGLNEWINVIYRKPSSFAAKQLDSYQRISREELQDRNLVLNGSGQMSLPEGATEIGVRGEIRLFDPNKPPRGFLEGSYLAHYFWYAESTNPGVLAITKSGHFEIRGYGQGTIHIRDLLESRIVASISYDIRNKCPSITYNRLSGQHYSIEAPKVDNVCVIPVLKDGLHGWPGEKSCAAVCNNLRLNKDLTKNFLNTGRHNLAINNRDRCDRDQLLTQTFRNKYYDTDTMHRNGIVVPTVPYDERVYSTHFDNVLCGYFDQKRWLGYFGNVNLSEIGKGPLCPCDL